MVLLSMLSWWYSAGWLRVVRSAWQKVLNLSRFFSARTLLATLFSPWKQIVSATGPQSSLGAMARNAIDNMVSRLVGFFVRAGTLFVAAVAILIFGLAGLVLAVLWPLVPPAMVWLLFIGIGAGA